MFKVERVVIRFGAVTDRTNSPVIWRCRACTGLIHPSDPRQPMAWCGRCRRIVEGIRDGGDDD